MTDRVTVDMRSEVGVSFGVGILDKSAAGWMRVAVKSVVPANRNTQIFAARVSVLIYFV